jgi:putative addiction module CopG family antidote
MTITLPESLQEFVRRRVREGAYESEDAAVADAVERMQADAFDEEARLQNLRAAIAQGEASAARGEVVVFETDEDIDRFFDALDAR